MQDSKRLHHIGRSCTYYFSERRSSEAHITPEDLSPGQASPLAPVQCTIYVLPPYT